MTVLVVGLLSILFGLMARWDHDRMYGRDAQQPHPTDPYGEAKTRMLAKYLPWVVGPVMVVVGALDLFGVFG